MKRTVQSWAKTDKIFADGLVLESLGGADVDGGVDEWREVLNGRNTCHLH